MKLVEQIQSDLKIALKAKDEIRVSTLRLLLAEIRNYQIQKQKDLTNEDLFAIIRRQIKQRQEAIEAYRKGARDDLAKKEEEEGEILSKYLPQPISPSELEKMIKATIVQLGAVGPKDLGRVMGAVMGRVKGKADGSQVSRIVKQLLEIGN